VIVGFDVSQTGERKAGCGYFADGLIRELVKVDPRTQYLLYPTFGDGVWDPRWPTRTVRLQQPNVRRAPGQRLFSQLRTFWRSDGSDHKLGNPDIIHANNFFCPTRVRRARLVYTLHDLGFLIHPEWTTEANRVTCFTGVFNASVCADHIVCVSQHTRSHFLATFPYYPAERTSVVHPASRFAGLPAPPRPARLAHLEPGGFWLNVGTLEPRKNHMRLLRAYARLRAARPTTPPLVIAGGRGWLVPDLQPAPDNVILLGYATDAELHWLYANCFAFVFPSLFEGFGMPVVEAMSQGAPVVASSTSSIPEVVGNAGVLVDPLDDDAIVRGLMDVADNDAARAALAARGRERGQAFTWRVAAEAIRSTYALVAASPRWGAQ
jgi:glycosyltransferase involved in cell wall biosynthesis